MLTKNYIVLILSTVFKRETLRNNDIDVEKTLQKYGEFILYAQKLFCADIKFS